jgi:hypothetical protein
VSEAYYYEAHYIAHPFPRDGRDPSYPLEYGDPMREPLVDKRSAVQQEPEVEEPSSNTTHSRLTKRAPKAWTIQEYSLSQISTPPGVRWGTRASYSVAILPDGTEDYVYRYENDPLPGTGQTIYLMHEYVLWTWHRVSFPFQTPHSQTCLNHPWPPLTL